MLTGVVLLHLSVVVSSFKCPAGLAGSSGEANVTDSVQGDFPEIRMTN
jgi:hypothetical protein